MINRNRLFSDKYLPENGLKRAISECFLQNGVFLHFWDFRNRLIINNVVIYIMYA